MTIGLKIKELRRAKGLSQKQLADFLGITCQAVSKWENEVTMPDISLIAPITKLLNVSADELLGLTGSENEKKRKRFDAAYIAYRNSGKYIDSYLAAGEAVSEFPFDFRYVEWLADAEYSLAREESLKPGGRTDYINELAGMAMERYTYITENCIDAELVKKAEKGKMTVLCFLENLR